MSKITKSLRGETINFDLFEIKNQMLRAPKTDNIHARERYIDKKRRRSSRKVIDNMLTNKKIKESSITSVEDTTALLPNVILDSTIQDSDALIHAAQTPDSEKKKRKITKKA